MQYLRRLTLIALFVPIFLCGQSANVSFEEDNTFFKYINELEEDNIDWGFLNVPENWNNPSGKKIKLAIAVLKAKEIDKSNDPVLFIEGGPGAGGIEGIWTWIDHPLRDKSDIILVDVRGTGYSEPRLCPELGKQFLEILAKDQSPQEDEAQKSFAAYECKRDLEFRKIDTKQYNSQAISKDLNALKNTLKYKSWNVFGVSYGTHVAQVYAQKFPNDVRTLILDSSISDITEYHDRNTSNYMTSLNKVFASCKNNSECNSKFPNLENLYYETINKLEKNPLTVKAGKNVVESEQFTYNAEDFKVSLQQALYSDNLIEVIPLLITEFSNENENTLSALVAAFAALLKMDYGVYYCMTCNEAIPANSFNEYKQDVNRNNKLKTGLSFYKSDYVVCDKWNDGVLRDTTAMKKFSFSKPVLVFAGEYDPITPAKNGLDTKNKYSNSYLVEVAAAGHGPSFSENGNKIVTEFVNNPSQKPKTEFPKEAVNFVTDVNVNGGISNFTNSIQNFSPVFFTPLLIALIVLLISVIFYFISLFQNIPTLNKIFGFVMILTSLLGIATVGSLIYGIVDTVPRNFYILAFGLPSNFDFIYILQLIFLGLMIFSTVFFILRITKMQERSLVLSVIFSFFVLSCYFYYWGFLGSMFS